MGQEENSYSAGSVLLTFFIGGLVGAGVALLLAPKTGRETRQKILELADEVKEKAETYIEKTKEKADTYAEEIRDKAAAVVEKGKGFIEEQKTIITSAVGAGKEAYEKEKDKLAAK
jgi:gas vesicle protein